MGSYSSLAGLKCLQWTFRAIEFGCSLIILAVYSYYLATLSNHSMEIRSDVKAVEGIAAIGTLYTALGLLLICCCAGYPATSFISLVFDIGLAASYIYVAVANRAATRSCSGPSVNTVYGDGDANATPGGGDGGMTGVQQVTGGATRLPTFQLACQLMMVCLIVSSVAIPFFIMSILLEVHINRKRYRNSRPIRDADGEYITKSDAINHGLPPQRRHGLKGLRGFPLLGASAAPAGNPDALPPHSRLGDMRTRQVEVSQQWGDVSSLHDSDRLEFNDGQDLGGGPVRMKSTTAPRPAAEVYTEGNVGDRVYSLYTEDKHGNDHSEVGKTKRHNETKAARLERLVAA